MHSPSLFMEFMTPVDRTATMVLPMYDWLDVDHWGKVRLYQLPTLPWDHMLPDDVPRDKTWVPGYDGIDRKNVGDAYVWGGRRTSKSFGLQHDVLQAGIVREAEETMLTSRDDNHLTKRLDSVWVYVKQHPLISELVVNSKRSSPYAIIDWFNGHITKGIYESTFGEGDNYLGSHSHRVLIDEFQLSSEEAMQKLHDATAEMGCVIRTTGVSDGRLDTPAHAIRNDPSMAHKVYVTPQFVTGFWTPAAKRNAIKNYDGEDSQGYVTNVIGEEGEPTASVWDIPAILACMRTVHADRNLERKKRRKVTCPVLILSGKELAAGRKVSDIEFPPVLDHGMPVWMSMDVGRQIHPSVIGIWGIDADQVPHMWGYIILRRVNYEDQAKLIEQLINYYGVSQLGIDRTGTDGLSVIEYLLRILRGIDADSIDAGDAEAVMALSALPVRIIPVVFSSTVEVPDLLVDQDKNWIGKKNKSDVKKLGLKYYVTTKLQDRIARQRIELLYDRYMISELQTEVSKATMQRYQTTPVSYYGPRGDHVIDMMRVLEFMLYKNLTDAPQGIMSGIMNFTLFKLGRM